MAAGYGLRPGDGYLLDRRDALLRVLQDGVRKRSRTGVLRSDGLAEGALDESEVRLGQRALGRVLVNGAGDDVAEQRDGVRRLVGDLRVVDHLGHVAVTLRLRGGCRIERGGGAC